MKKVLTLMCFYLGLWGLAGFFLTIALGLLVCCAGLSHDFYYVVLALFALLGIAMTCKSVFSCCKNHSEAS